MGQYIRVSLFLTMVVLGVGVSVVTYFGYAGNARPRIRVDRKYIDLGYGRPSETLKGTFTIANIGRKELTYSIVESCSCTGVFPKSGRLAAKGVQEVTFTVTLSPRVNSERSASLAIQSNDPRVPTVICVAKASCPSPLAVSPSVVSFGEIVTTNRTMDAVQTLALTCDADVAVRYEVEGEFFSVRRSSSATGEYLVSLNEELAAGNYHGTIRFVPRMDPALALPVPVHVVVSEPISVVPPVIHVRAGSAQREIAVLLRSCRPVDGRRATLCPNDAGVSIHSRQQLSPQLVRLVLRMDQAATTPDKSELQFAIDSCRTRVQLVRQ